MTQGNYTDEMRSDEIRWPSACQSRGGGESVGGGGEEFKNDRYWENCLFKNRDPLGNVTAFLLVLVNVVNFLLIKSLIYFLFFYIHTYMSLMPLRVSMNLWPSIILKLLHGYVTFHTFL